MSRRTVVVIAVLLLILGLALPWNIYVGLGIDGTAGWFIAVLVAATLMSGVSAALGHVRRRVGPAWTRLALGIPYLVVVAVFVGFAVLQSIRYAGTGVTPPGVGPGLWAGLAGALLVARAAAGPLQSEARWGRMAGGASIVLASLAVLLTIYWRTRFVIPHISDPETSRQNLTVAVTAVLYGLVSLAPVIVAGRWLMSGRRHHQLASAALGTSMLLAGSLVWLLPVGRDLDAFHGIAQITSTAGVGFEGYLAWAAAIALFAPRVESPRRTSELRQTFQGVIKDALLLIAVWAAGCALLRIADIASVAVLELPAPPYNSTVMMAFDLLTALVAGWLAINGASNVLPQMVNVLLVGIVFVLTVTRVVIGVMLVPRVKPLDARQVNAVYGNTLAHQVTSTFDVGLCFLSLAVLALAMAVVLRTNRATVSPRPATPSTAVPIVGREPDKNVCVSAKERADAVLAESTRRFAAGTTYGDAGSDHRR